MCRAETSKRGRMRAGENVKKMRMSDDADMRMLRATSFAKEKPGKPAAALSTPPFYCHAQKKLINSKTGLCTYCSIFAQCFSNYYVIYPKLGSVSCVCVAKEEYVISFLNRKLARLCWRERLTLTKDEVDNALCGRASCKLKEKQGN